MSGELQALAADIPDGAMIVVPPDYSGVAMATTLALIAREARNFHLVCAPTSGLQADLLIGAGAVASIETSAVSLGEHGAAPRFNAAVRAGSIRVLDATCPAIHAGLMAAEKGMPFAPLRGLVGSDLLRYRPDWRPIANPCDAGETVVAIPAIKPDVALFHAPLADREGNLWVGRRRELMTLAHAAKATFATVETIQDTSLYADEKTAAGVIPALYVTRIVQAPLGAWPLGLWDRYEADGAALARYAAQAGTQDGFAAILAAWQERLLQGALT
jgi:glutaconate CoA-transferase subunit A